MNYEFHPLVQFDQDALDHLYKEAFGYKNDGTFVEVGGYDGNTYSHTVGLAKMGWRGVFVEPDPRLFAQLAANHIHSPRISMHRAACGRYGSVDVTMHQDEFSCCGSTLNPDVCKNDHPFITQLRTLDSILRFEQIGYGFDLLSIDVEFAECEVLSGFTLKDWMPRMVIIELCEMHDEPKHTWAKPARDMAYGLFPPAGYRVVHVDMINTIFVR